MKSSKKWIALLAGLALAGGLLLTSSCGKKDAGADSESTDKDSGKLEVVTTTTMITDMVQQIAGGSMKVTGLMGPGVDPHDYQAGPSDASALRRADVIIYNGTFLEGTMTDRLDDLASKGEHVLALGSTVDKSKLFQPAGENHADPHFWGDAGLWAEFVPAVTALLAKADPPNATAYEERGAALQKKYEAMDAWAKTEIAKVPEGHRVLVTSHDAFNYFGSAYGLEVLGVQGISTTSEPGLADVLATIKLVKERGVPAVFVESSVSKGVIERISKDSGAKIGGELFSDAAGTPGEMVTINGREVDLGTYEGMFMFNVDTVVKALSSE